MTPVDRLMLRNAYLLQLTETVERGCSVYRPPQFRRPEHEAEVRAAKARWRRLKVLSVLVGISLAILIGIGVCMAMLLISPPPGAPIGFELAVSLLSGSALTILAIIAAVLWLHYRHLP